MTRYSLVLNFYIEGFKQAQMAKSVGCKWGRNALHMPCKMFTEQWCAPFLYGTRGWGALSGKELRTMAQW